MLNSILDKSVTRLIQIALAEDIGTGDITSEATISTRSKASAKFLVKQDGVVCGLPIAKAVFQEFEHAVDWEELVAEGTFVQAGTVVATVKGFSRTLLTAERTALNFMQRMSGVATLTQCYVEVVQGTGAQILDTRKTLPGWRILDKYAVRIGGGKNHRVGLYDMVMIKDNHIAAAGSITKAVKKCLKELNGKSIGIEVETRTLSDVREALSCKGVTRIMFDNFTPELMREGVKLVAGKVETEASGGITLETIRKYAETGVNFISVGALTHSATALDISMKFV